MSYNLVKIASIQAISRDMGINLVKLFNVFTMVVSSITSCTRSVSRFRLHASVKDNEIFEVGKDGDAMPCIPSVFSRLKRRCLLSEYVNARFLGFNEQTSLSAQGQRIVGAFSFGGIVFSNNFAILRCHSTNIANVPSEQDKELVDEVISTRVVVVILRGTRIKVGMSIIASNKVT